MIARIAQVAALLGAEAPAAAPVESEPILVTASRTPGGEAAAVTSLDEEEIARFVPASALELLDTLPGVRAFSTGGIGGGTFLSVRGGEPNFTLAMIDGVRVNNPANSRGGAFDFSQIDPFLIERIEVSAGGLSAVHGSDALSGAVHLLLRRPRPGDSGGAVRATVDGRGSAGAGISLSRGWAAGGLLAGAAAFDSGGLDRGSDLDRRQLLVRLNQRAAGFEAGLLALHARTDRSVFPEDSGGPLFAVVRERERVASQLTLAALTLQRAAAPAVRPRITLNWSEQDEDSRAPAIAPGVLDGVPAIEARSRVSRFEAIAEVGVSRGPVAATAGAAWLDESGRSRGSIDFGFPLPVRFALERRTASAFAEADLAPHPALGVNLALRYDDVADGPSRLTSRAGLRLRPRPDGPLLFARYGEGYKLPSFYALGHPLVGNPGLRPERSRNLEAGIEWPWASGELRLTGFDNRFRDLIDFDPLLFRTVNRDRVRARGVEAELRWRPAPAIDLRGALTFVDLDSQTPLRGRPRWHGAARASWRARADLELAAALRFNSRFFDSSIPTGPVVAEGHAEADLALSWRLAEPFTLSLAVRNLADSRHQDAVGFPAAGRHLRAALSARF